MVWCGVVWYGMVWCGVVWYGMVWYGMVWYTGGAAKACPVTPEICNDDGPCDSGLPGKIIIVVPGDLQWIFRMTL